MNLVKIAIKVVSNIEFVIDPAKTLPAVQEALEKLTGRKWKYKGPFEKHEKNFAFARFFSPSDKDKGQDLLTTRVEWGGSGKFAFLSVQSKKHGISMSGLTSPQKFEDANFLVKSWEANHLEL